LKKGNQSKNQNPSAPTVSVYAYYAWTTDGSGNNKSSFNSGETIRYDGQIYNSTGGTQTAYVQWYRSTPCGSGYLYQNYMSIPAGYPWWYVTMSASCPGTHTYTLYVSYGGSTTSRSTSYTVNGGGSVSAYYA